MEVIWDDEFRIEDQPTFLASVMVWKHAGRLDKYDASVTFSHVNDHHGTLFLCSYRNPLNCNGPLLLCSYRNPSTSKPSAF